MSFFVRRSLGAGAIRFGVAERVADPGEGSEGLSTGPEGEYLRHRGGGLFFTDNPRLIGETSPTATLHRRNESALKIADWASMAWGAFLVFIGIMMLIRKGYWTGYVEILLGILFIALPFILSAKRRRDLRQRLQKERLEREAEEKRIREVAGAWIGRVEKLRTADDAALLGEIASTRAKDVPYSKLRLAARAAVQRVGFDALARGLKPTEIAAAIDRAADATGLEADDRREVKRLIVLKAWWHLLADDRMTLARRQRLEDLASRLGLGDEDLAVEQRSADQFVRLGGIAPATLPRVECPIRLRPLEHCILLGRARITSPKIRKVRESDGTRRAEEVWEPRSEETLVLTNQRLLIGRGKGGEIDVKSVYDLEVDADRGIVTIVEGGSRRRVHHLATEEPIVLAGLIQMAQHAPLKPKGLV